MRSVNAAPEFGDQAKIRVERFARLPATECLVILPQRLHGVRPKEFIQCEIPSRLPMLVKEAGLTGSNQSTAALHKPAHRIDLRVRHGRQVREHQK